MHFAESSSRQVNLALLAHSSLLLTAFMPSCAQQQPIRCLLQEEAHESESLPATVFPAPDLLVCAPLWEEGLAWRSQERANSITVVAAQSSRTGVIPIMIQHDRQLDFRLAFLSSSGEKQLRVAVPGWAHATMPRPTAPPDIAILEKFSRSPCLEEAAIAAMSAHETSLRRLALGVCIFEGEDSPLVLVCTSGSSPEMIEPRDLLMEIIQGTINATIPEIENELKNACLLQTHTLSNAEWDSLAAPGIVVNYVPEGRFVFGRLSWDEPLIRRFLLVERVP